MKQIAERAGVSVMTVSLALRGSARVSTPTRQRINLLSQRLGFRPDPVLQALVAYRSSKRTRVFEGTIAYLNNYPEQPSVIDQIAIHRSFFSGARYRAEQLGFRIEEFWCHAPGMSSRRLTDILLARGIRGLLIPPQPVTHSTLAIDWSHFASVRLSYSLEKPRLHAVVGNHFHAVELALKHLVVLGYNRIGLVIPSGNDDRTENRYSGAYMAYCERHPRSLAKLPLFEAPIIERDHLLRWFDLHQPDAILAGCLRLQNIFANEGIDIPKDLGLATLFPPEPEMIHEIAHVDDIPGSVGAAAIEFLTDMIAQNQFGVPEVPRNLTLDPTWKFRPSLRQILPVKSLDTLAPSPTPAL